MASYDIIVKAVDGTRAAFNSIDRSLTGLTKNAKAAQKSIDDMTGGLQKAGAVASAALALGARSAILFTSKVNDANAATGIAREKILALGQALAVNGGDANKASQAIVEFNERLGAARIGAGEQANALYALGISYEELSKLQPEQAFERVVQALSGVTDQSKSAKIATALFADTMKGVNVKGIAGDYDKLVGKQKEAAEATKAIGQASDSLNQAWVRVQLSIAKALKPAADFINKLSPEQLDALIGAVGKLAVAIAGLSAGLKIFSVTASVLATYWTLFGKGVALASVGASMAGAAISSLGKTAAITFSVLKNYAAPAIWNAIKAGSGIFTEIGITIATLGKRLGYVLKAVGGLGGAVKMLAGGFARMLPLIGIVLTLASLLNEGIKLIFGVDIIDAFIDKFKQAWDNIVKYASDKWNAFKNIFGLGEKAAAALPPTGAGAGRGKVNPAVVNPNTPAPTVALNPKIEEAQRQLDTLNKDYAELTLAVDQATSLNQLSMLFAQQSAAAEQLGIVLEKDAILINRDYKLAIDKASEALRQHQIEVKDTASVQKEFQNAVAEEAVALAKTRIQLADTGTVLKRYRQSVEASGLELQKHQIEVKDTASVIKEFQIAVGEEAVALAKTRAQLADFTTVQQQYALSVQAGALEIQKQEMLLANSVVTQQKWNNELAQTNLQIYEQSLKLGDAAYMQKMFDLEIAQTNNNLREQEKRLANSGYQSDKFIQSMQQASIDMQQSAITLALLNAEFDKGKMPLETYVKLLNGIDSSLLGIDEKTRQLLASLEAENKAYTDNFFIADQLNQAYLQGKITAEQYAKGVSQLGEEFFKADEVLKAHLITTQKAIDTEEKQKSMLALLTEQFKAGTVSAAQFRKEAGALGQDTAKTDRMVNTYGKAVDLMKENNEALKKSIDDAATTFSKEFTDAFVNMKNPLDAFKNMFTNILNDIATRIVKQQLADPMADLISKTMNEIMGTGGSGKGGVAQIMTEGATQGGEGMLDTFKTYGTKIMESMGSMGQGITNLFSGMGDSLMSIFGDVFNWISQNASSLGDSLGSLLGGIGGMFGGGGGDFFGGIGEFFSGFFADGGTIPSGQFGIVGEAGPEFVTGPATVTPMNVDQVNSDSNGGLTVNFQLYAIDTQSGVQFLLQNKPAIISMVGEAYNKRGRRGPLD